VVISALIAIDDRSCSRVNCAYLPFAPALGRRQV
jgi:hypothetical protein